MCIRDSNIAACNWWPQKLMSEMSEIKNVWPGRHWTLRNVIIWRHCTLKGSGIVWVDCWGGFYPGVVVRACVYSGNYCPLLLFNTWLHYLLIKLSLCWEFPCTIRCSTVNCRFFCFALSVGVLTLLWTTLKLTMTVTTMMINRAGSRTWLSCRSVLVQVKLADDD